MTVSLLVQPTFIKQCIAAFVYMVSVYAAMCRPAVGSTRQSAVPTKIQPIINRSTPALNCSSSLCGNMSKGNVRQAALHCIDAIDDDDDFLPEL